MLGDLISGEGVLAPAAPLGAQLRAAKWPCSSMVAAWLMAIHGHEARTMGGWAKIRPDLWRAVNLYDPIDNPWAGVTRAHRYAGDRLQINEPGVAHHIQLTHKSWHVVQRWRQLGWSRTNWLGGHAFLVYFDGASVRVVQSDMALGFRDETFCFSRWALEQAKYAVGVSHMPRVPK